MHGFRLRLSHCPPRSVEAARSHLEGKDVLASFEAPALEHLVGDLHDPRPDHVALDLHIAHPAPVLAKNFCSRLRASSAAFVVALSWRRRRITSLTLADACDFGYIPLTLVV